MRLTPQSCVPPTQAGCAAGSAGTTAGSPATALVVRETRTYGRGNCGTTQRRALETGSERPAPSQTRQLHELPCHPPKAGRTTRTANRKRPRRRRVVETQPLPTSTSPASIQPISALPPPPAIDGALRKSESSRHFVTNPPYIGPNKSSNHTATSIVHCRGAASCT